MTDVATVMGTAPVIPVLVIEDAAHAVPIATALVAGGLRVLEVTLRTPAALDVIAAMAKVPGAIVGAGTVLNAREAEASVAAGATFLFSPGLTEAVAHAAADLIIPYVPGVATASDIMRGLDLGLSAFKFFPAMAMGGIATVKSLAGPYPQVKFCPTGGITQANAAEWLALDMVPCVGGSWVVPKGTPDVAAIEAAARAAASLKH